MFTVNSMRGLGDNIYQRAFVKQLKGHIYIDTPWPELYADIENVHFVRPATKLRTQLKNVARHSGWSGGSTYSRQLHIAYGGEGIIGGMTRSFGVSPGAFDLPATMLAVPEWLADIGPYVVVRPVTLRSEWLADTRNPLPVYVAEAAALAASLGFTIISVADLEPGKEWLVGAPPPAHIEYHSGQLDVVQLMNVVAGATAVIGGIGWAVPACIAAGVPAWIVCGGQGGFNAPELICPPDTRISFAVPDRFCRCKLKQHNCDKRITNHAADFTSWAERHLALV